MVQDCFYIAQSYIVYRKHVSSPLYCLLYSFRKRLHSSTPIAKFNPTLAPIGDRIALAIPTIWPPLSNKGPPLFPGLIAASVCTSTKPSSSNLDTPLMIPRLTLYERSIGCPTTATV